ncbi:ubiquitin carboxyl-terminal hydrolase [Sphaerosporella brunnea]|uniref:Ubiquitin carboxyl-terminal hydrolase n=1 Tax=Sphaerosporella brunnea TaxID=1250544 RepID=A0A5J5EPR3_9PEZI|nr:ubiquitin carboxyl-terminal hydrolase [Sphaerosporella brunnea]
MENPAGADSTPVNTSTVSPDLTPDATATTSTPSEVAWPGWASIESEPAVFQALLRALGTSGCQVQELYSLDDEESLRALNPALGIVFLFRWKPEVDDEVEVSCPEGVWFANQVIDNACATIALLNIVFNSDAIISEELRNLKDFTAPLTPAMKGLAVANSARLRDQHNSFAREHEKLAVDLNFEEVAATKPKLAVRNVGDDDDGENHVYHFIAYVHVVDTLYELDGLRKAPVKIKTCPKEDWTVHAGARILERVARYPEGEIEFSAQAVVSGNTIEDENLEKIARSRQVDWEGFVHKACTLLAANGMARKILAPPKKKGGRR